MSAETLDPHIAGLMDPDELAAIQAGPDPEEVAALARLAAGDDDDDDEDGADDDGADDGAAGDPAPAASAPAPAPAQAASGDGAAPAPAPASAESPAPAAPQPVYQAALPEDFQAQVDAIETQRAELRTKFKAGDIELDEYEDQVEALNRKREDLTVARTKAEVAAEITQQSAMQRWQSAINRHFDAAAKPEAGGVDYRTDTAKQADLDGFIRMLANKPENADKDENWFLSEAHKRVLALHDIRPAAAAPAPAAPPASRRSDPSRAPKTLAQVPGADGPGDIGSEFADLDALEGEALELAVARMTPEARARFAAGH